MAVKTGEITFQLHAMKKTKLTFVPKLVLHKEAIAPLTSKEKIAIIAGGTLLPSCVTLKCLNSCALPLCNTPETTGCPPTQ
ncbi:class I lanthipeptide [Taibaiella helva]|uniref:class I lanthipeptide n=1 Tax=Taibaiella helva TaxID=2301235 RepID=UPI000E597023